MLARGKPVRGGMSRSPLPNYRIELTSQAERGLRQIAKGEPALYVRVVHAIDDLGRDPFQGKALKGELKGRYSYRVGVTGLFTQFSIVNCLSS